MPQNNSTVKKACTCCVQGEKEEQTGLTEHWNKTYNKEINKLGWYEETPEPSLQLIKKCNLGKGAPILNVGAGATTLIDELLTLGHESIIANDLSTNALEKLKLRLGDNSSKVHWVIDDLLKPTQLNNIGEVDLWHDRAVLHFFNEKSEQDCYFQLLKKLVKKGGYVIIAAFNLNGATKCSGLPVYRYDQNMLSLKLGQEFKLLESFNYTYTNPFGDTRNYIYTMFKRK